MDTGILAQVLAALAQGAAGKAGQQAWTALAALATRLPGRGAAETKVIEAARAGEPDPAGPGHLAEALAGKAGADPRFAAGLEDWLARAQAHIICGQPTVNQVTGPVPGTVIQARDVFGGIRLGGPPGPAA